MKARMRFAIAGVVVALGIALALASTTGAEATQGQPVVAGQNNSETSITRVQNTSVSLNCVGFSTDGLSGCGESGVDGYGTSIGVYGNGPTGVQGIGTTYGVQGYGGPYGVYGQGGTGVYGTGGTGVYGVGTENGVQASGGTFGLFATGTDYGIYGSGPNHGVFGQATSSSGAGVEAAGTGGGIALKVNGKAQFSRSGKATVAGTASTPKNSVTVTGKALTSSSLILAVLQKNVAGVWVAGVVPNVAGSSFTIYLNKSVTTSVGPIAWFIVN
jgi:hypothetical protein